MKTIELIQLSESELAPKLKQMKLKELEGHGQKLLAKFVQLEDSDSQSGDTSYSKLLANVIRQVPKLDENSADGRRDRFSEMKRFIKDFIQSTDVPKVVSEAEYEDLLSRLTIVLMVVVTSKFQAIHNKS